MVGSITNHHPLHRYRHVVAKPDGWGVRTASVFGLVPLEFKESTHGSQCVR